MYNENERCAICCRTRLDHQMRPAGAVISCGLFVAAPPSRCVFDINGFRKTLYFEQPPNSYNFAWHKLSMASMVSDSHPPAHLDVDLITFRCCGRSNDADGEYVLYTAESLPTRRVVEKQFIGFKFVTDASVPAGTIIVRSAADATRVLNIPSGTFVEIK